MAFIDPNSTTKGSPKNTSASPLRFAAKTSKVEEFVELATYITDGLNFDSPIASSFPSYEIQGKEYSFKLDADFENSQFSVSAHSLKSGEQVQGSHAISQKFDFRVNRNFLATQLYRLIKKVDENLREANRCTQCETLRNPPDEV